MWNGSYWLILQVQTRPGETVVYSCQTGTRYRCWMFTTTKTKHMLTAWPAAFIASRYRWRIPAKSPGSGMFTILPIQHPNFMMTVLLNLPDVLLYFSTV